MAGIPEFEIVLKEREVVEGGTNITGQVIVDLAAPIQMLSLTILLEGEACCHWVEQRGSGPFKSAVHYSNEELLICETKSLFNELQKSDPSKLVFTHPAGRRFYPFTFTIPTNSPSSIEASLGFIRYTLEGTIVELLRAEKERKLHVVKQPLILVERIDPNLPEYLLRPGRSTSNGESCCFPPGMISIDASLSRAAFCVGEKIYVDVDVVNASDREILFVKAKLVKTTAFNAEDRRKIEQEEVLGKMVGPKIPPGKKRGFLSSDSLFIPLSTTPTICRGSKAVEVSYSVRVKAIVPGGDNFGVSLPIVIGNVPFRGRVGASNPTTDGRLSWNSISTGTSHQHASAAGKL